MRPKSATSQRSLGRVYAARFVLMARVAWTTYDGADIEHVVAMMLCRENPSAQVIRPASGDGGIDIKVPTETPGPFDVYQVKKFATNLTDGQKTQIKKSLARLKKTVDSEEHFSVRNWYLTMPLDPTPGNVTWFDEMTAGYDWNSEWRGFNFVDGLAGTYPELVDYYLLNGSERMRAATVALAAAFGIPQNNKEEVAIVTPASVFDRLQAVQALLDTDPHFAYDIHLDKSRRASLVTSEGLVASVQMGYADPSKPCLTVNVYARFAEAVNERPIPLNFDIKVEPGTKLDEDLKMFQKYGTPFTAPQGAVSGSIGLPGGLGGDFEAGALYVFDPSGDPYDIRLQVRDATYELLAEVPVQMQPVTVGLDKSGVRAHGRDHAEVFEMELLTDLEAKTSNIEFRSLNASGKPPAAILPALKVLAAIHAPNQIVLARPYGPVTHPGVPLIRTDPLWPDLHLDKLVKTVEDLLLIQEQTSVKLLIPEELTLTESNSISNSARLLRGEVVRIKPARTPHISSEQLTFGGTTATTVVFSVPFAPMVSGQQIDLGQVWYVCTDVTLDPSSLRDDDLGQPCAQAVPSETSTMWVQRDQPADLEEIQKRVDLFSAPVDDEV